MGQEELANKVVTIPLVTEYMHYFGDMHLADMHYFGDRVQTHALPSGFCFWRSVTEGIAVSADGCLTTRYSVSSEELRALADSLWFSCVLGQISTKTDFKLSLF